MASAIFLQQHSYTILVKIHQMDYAGKAVPGSFSLPSLHPSLLLSLPLYFSLPPPLPSSLLPSSPSLSLSLPPCSPSSITLHRAFPLSTPLQALHSLHEVGKVREGDGQRRWHLRNQTLQQNIYCKVSIGNLEGTNEKITMVDTHIHTRNFSFSGNFPTMDG